MILFIPPLPIAADCEQVEHCSDRSHDVFPRGRGKHTGAPGPFGEM